MSTQAVKYWTYADLLALPDDGRRYEIIRGELYEMPAPSFAHAVAIANLMVLVFGPVVYALGGRVLTAPLDVFLPDADPVQPDLVILLPEQLVLHSQRGLEGPPDLIVEVLSPSNPERDLVTKRALYERAGVREYWLVHLEARRVEILVLRGTNYQPLLVATGQMQLLSTVLPTLNATTDQIFA